MNFHFTFTEGRIVRGCALLFFIEILFLAFFDYILLFLILIKGYNLKQNKVLTISEPVFLDYIHSFRGLAILKIVFGHAMAAAFIGVYSYFDDSHPILMTSEIFYHDSTLYFAIISGLLFSKILKHKGYLHFYKSKLKHILLPYLFVTIVFTLTKIDFNHFSSFNEGLAYVLHKIWMNFVFGQASFALWYIPVLLFLYVITPVLDFLLTYNNFSKYLFFIIIFMPLLISRIPIMREYNLRFETLVYFTGAYSLGMFLGSHLNKNLVLIKTNKVLILIIAIMSTIGLFYLYIGHINVLGNVNIKETVFYIQKICFAFLFILFFYNYRKQPVFLKPIARDSFSIYFLHGSILYSILPLCIFVFKDSIVEPVNAILIAIVLFILSIFISRIIVFLFRKILPRHSRIIIGA
jgi:hypothetical protein